MDKKLDVSSAYPNSEIIFNIGKEQTLRELCEIQGLSETVKRQVSLNLTMPRINAHEICRSALGAPDMFEVLARYQKDRAAQLT